MRFTASLRAQGADTALPTPDVLYIQANKALDEERKRRDRAPGLAERIFRETPVPKAVRSLVSGFVRAVLEMLGGDASAAVVSEEVAFQVWQDPRSEVLREHQGPGVARVLEARSALQSACDGLGVAVNGGAVNGGAVNGGAVNGDAVNGDAVNGDGGDVGPEAHRPLTPPAASGPTVPTTPTTKGSHLQRGAVHLWRRQASDVDVCER
jgi:hypothetical protein